MASPQKWPDRIHWIVDQVRLSNGMFAVALPNEHTVDTVRLIGEESQSVVSIGKIATTGSHPPSETEMTEAIGDATVFTDLGVLFDFDSPLDPINFIRRLTRTAPRVVVWPGHIEEGLLMYGTNGSRHRRVWTPENVVLFDPVPQNFPDELPFSEIWIQ